VLLGMLAPRSRRARRAERSGCVMCVGRAHLQSDGRTPGCVSRLLK
jgi:hypothetical protein